MLSDYRLGRQLHRSGSGAVFVAEEASSGRTVVVKRKDTAELGARKAIEHEATLLQQLSHPNIARCLTTFKAPDEGGAFFLVLEYADQGDLGQLLDRRRAAQRFLGEREVWGLFTQICAGVSCLHSQRIIHRDLKPRNVLLFSGEGGSGGSAARRLTAKIADLGVSRQLSDDTMLASTFYGTPLYISPELCHNEPYSEKTDIWSLGVVLYELAALRTPFVGGSVVELARGITRGTYPPLPASYSTTMVESVRTMLRTAAAARPTIDQYCLWLQQRLRRRMGTAATAVHSSNSPGSSTHPTAFDGAAPPPPLQQQQQQQSLQQMQSPQQQRQQRQQQQHPHHHTVPGGSVEAAAAAAAAQRHYASASAAAASTTTTQQHHHAWQHGRSWSHGGATASEPEPPPPPRPELEPEPELEPPMIDPERAQQQQHQRQSPLLPSSPERGSVSPDTEEDLPSDGRAASTASGTSRPSSSGLSMASARDRRLEQRYSARSAHMRQQEEEATTRRRSDRQPRGSQGGGGGSGGGGSGGVQVAASSQLARLRQSMAGRGGGNHAAVRASYEYATGGEAHHGHASTVFRGDFGDPRDGRAPHLCASAS
jgi:serine/threonine protein kinase